MNIRQNPISQPRTAPTQKPLNAKAVAEQIKQEGEQEVARGEQLQQDGVELQTRGSELTQQGQTSVEVGENSKTQGQAKIEQGQAQKAEGEEKITSGLQAEIVARNNEAQHQSEFQVGLDGAKAARESADKAIEALQTGLSAEKTAHAQEGGLLTEYGGKVVEAGANRAASVLLQSSAAGELQKEKDAQASATEATGSFKQGIDTQAEGRKLQGDGRNDLRVSDDLKGQSEAASNRGQAYLDRATAHFSEATKLGEEALSHQESSSEYTDRAGVTESLGQVAQGQADAQSAIASLMAAKALIDNAAASSLAGLSHFHDESVRTRGEAVLAAGQAVTHTERGKFYGSVADGLFNEATELNGQAGIEDQQAGIKLDGAANRSELGLGDGKRSAKHFSDANDLATRSAEFKERGDARIAEGEQKHAEGTATLEQALGQLQTATDAQQASHEAQTALHEQLTGINAANEQLIADREALLPQISDASKAQTGALSDQLKALGSYGVAYGLGGASQSQRESALEGLKTEGANISGSIAQQGEGFAQRTQGAANEQTGAGMVRDGEYLIKDGSAKIADGERITEEGRQKEEAGKIVAEKGKQYQEIAEKAAQEIPFHIAP